MPRREPWNSSLSAKGPGGIGLAVRETVPDRSAQFLEANLAWLPPASQAALRAATTQPAVTLQPSGPFLQATVRTDDGRWVPVHPSDDPAAASDRTAARLAATHAPVIVVVGLGLGYLLDALERRGSTAKVLAIEPIPAVTRAMLGRRDFANWLKTGRLTILVGPDYAGASDAWSLVSRGTAPPTIMSPVLEREFGEEAARATALARQIVAGARANEGARRLFAGRYLLNTLRNVPVIASEGDAAALFGAFPRVPAVVVGAGPSLDRNLKDIAKLEGRILIIAVDAAVRPLLAAGIRPHMVVAVDPSELNGRHLMDLTEHRGMWLVAEASTAPAVFTQFAGRTFTFKVSQHDPWTWLDGCGAGRGMLRAWGSVLTTAFDLACHAGCDPIVFAGADLAYTDGLEYCRNTVYEERWKDLPTNDARAGALEASLRERPHQTELDVRGGSVLTTPHFVQFRDWIASRANEAADRRIVNATGGGILHGGRIAQTDFSVLHLPRSKHDLGLHRRLAAAWSSGAEQRQQCLPRLQMALGRRDALPLAAWRDFGGDTISIEQIEQCVEDAARGVALAARTSHYLAERSAGPEVRGAVVTGPEDPAEEALAIARDRALQAHVLLDFLSRTYRVEPGGSARDILGHLAIVPTALRVLDVGCGVGRAMVPLVEIGLRVDGVDVSQRMLELARQDPRLSASQFFPTDGHDCGAAPDGTYDLAYSIDCLHLITSRTVRRHLLASMARALTPSGALVVQMPFHPDALAATVPSPHVSWDAEVFDDLSVRRGARVWPTPDSLPSILEDFSERFHDVRLQFVDVPQGAARPEGTSGRTTHVVISGSPAAGLAARMFSQLRPWSRWPAEPETAATITTQK